jgi:hypothetical protein
MAAANQIYDALINDHRLLLSLLVRMASRQNGEDYSLDELFDEFEIEFYSHLRAEEKILYDTLKEIPSTEDLAMEAYEEHHAIEHAWQELKAAPSEDRRWRTKFEVFRENLESHIEEEEGELFLEARGLITDEEAKMLATAFECLKQDLMDGVAPKPALSKAGNLMPTRFAKRFGEI